MADFRVREAALLSGVSDDTIRRWASEGLLEVSTDDAGVQVVSGRSLADRIQQRAPETGEGDGIVRSARNSFVGLVTRIETEGLVSIMELQCGPNRVVSMMTSEACEELGLEIGSQATAVVKATQVIIEAKQGKRNTK